MASPKITEDSLQSKSVEEPEVTAEDLKENPHIKDILTHAAVDPNTLTDAERENLLGWKKRKTLEMLKKAPKIRMIIPFNVGEDKNNKANWYHPFGINGVFINVRKGVYVEVPEPIFTLYQDSIRETTPEESKAAENSMGNISMKIDPVTQRNKSIDALS